MQTEPEICEHCKNFHNLAIELQASGKKS